MGEPQTDYSTTIGPDATFKGRLEFDKGVNLLGKFDGEIESKGRLIVAQGARMTGEVHAGDIRVDGEVKGNLHADAKVHLSASGRLEGDIQASKLEVAEGAVLVGRCLVGTNGKAAAPHDNRPAADPNAGKPRIQQPVLQETRK